MTCQILTPGFLVPSSNVFSKEVLLLRLTFPYHMFVLNKISGDTEFYPFNHAQTVRPIPFLPNRLLRFLFEIMKINQDMTLTLSLYMLKCTLLHYSGCACVSFSVTLFATQMFTHPTFALCLQLQWWYLCGRLLAWFVLVRGVRLLTSILTSVSGCFLQGSARCPNLQTQVRPMACSGM